MRREDLMAEDEADSLEDAAGEGDTRSWNKNVGEMW